MIYINIAWCIYVKIPPVSENYSIPVVKNYCCINKVKINVWIFFTFNSFFIVCKTPCFFVILWINVIQIL